MRHEGAPHWFLRGPLGQILDLTASQFKTRPNYSAGRGKGFLTREPSARARVLMGRVLTSQSVQVASAPPA